MDQGDLTGELGQVHGFLNSGVAAANHEDLEVLEEVGVAGSAEGNALTNELALVLTADGPGECAGGQDDGLSLILTLVADQGLDGTLQLDFLDNIRNALCAKLGDLSSHTSDQRRTALLAQALARIIFNFIGDSDLTAILAFLDNQRRQAAASGIKTSGQTGGAGTQDNDIVNLAHWNHSYNFFNGRPMAEAMGLPQFKN